MGDYGNFLFSFTIAIGQIADTLDQKVESRSLLKKARLPMQDSLTMLGK